MLVIEFALDHIAEFFITLKVHTAQKYSCLCVFHNKLLQPFDSQALETLQNEGKMKRKLL
jgi:hypothetical protein